MPKVLSRFSKYLSSNKFYRLVLIVFVFEAVWIALSAAYPQAFDENFHFGLIKVYSHYWLPFLSKQPPNADAFGAVARDPSYLYHYLMSFPYRLIALVVKSQTAQIIALRLINVALFSFGIVLFRKVLIRVGASKALSNLLLMLFVLIPIVPQLAAQINYDNLMIPLTAALILLAFKITDSIKRHTPSVGSIILLISGCLFTSLVKYAFLPIFAAIALFLIVYTFKSYRHQIKAFGSQLLVSWGKYKWPAKAALSLLLIISLGMFIQRDGVNLVVYHNIQPNCSKVLSVKQCLAYSPWAYNYKKHLLLSKVHLANPLAYPFQWIYWMWYRLFFAINGPNSKFANYPPLPLPSAATLLLIIIGVVALIRYRRKIFKNNLYLILLALITLFYLVALIGQGYITYRYTDVLENMNGRYLLPILLLAGVILGQAISYSLSQSPKQKVIMALVALLFFIEGGGLITFIVRSDDSWYINNKAVVKVNQAAKKVVKTVVIRGKKTYSTPIWFFN